MPKIDRPKTLQIGAKSYKCHWSADEWMERPNQAEAPSSCWGVTDHIRLGVWISPELEEQNKRETLLHEALHCLHAASGGEVATEALAHMTGPNEAEEFIVSRLEAPLYAFLRNNPEALAYILG